MKLSCAIVFSMKLLHHQMEVALDYVSCMQLCTIEFKKILRVAELMNSCFKAFSTEEWLT